MSSDKKADRPLDGWIGKIVSRRKEVHCQWIEAQYQQCSHMRTDWQEDKTRQHMKRVLMSEYPLVPLKRRCSSSDGLCFEKKVRATCYSGKLLPLVLFSIDQQHHDATGQKVKAKLDEHGSYAIKAIKLTGKQASSTVRGMLVQWKTYLIKYAHCTSSDVIVVHSQSQCWQACCWLSYDKNCRLNGHWLRGMRVSLSK